MCHELSTDFAIHVDYHVEGFDNVAKGPAAEL
jgi:hypothetical protein